MPKKIILIDGSNVFHALKEKKKKINYDKFKTFLIDGIDNCSITYYGSRPVPTPSGQLGFLYTLQNLGYSLKILELKIRDSRPVEKGVDAAIVNDLNSIIQDDADCKEVTLVAGDKDYLETLEKLKRKGIKINIAAFESTISPDLRLTANKFISLDLNLPKFEMKEEPQKSAEQRQATSNSS